MEAIGWTLLQRKPVTPESTAVFPPELVGVGIALDLNEQTRALRITKVLPNSPAAQAGLSPGLIVRRIGDVPVEGKGLAECVKLLRGNAGTKVRLELLGPDGKSKTVELTRQKILATRTAAQGDKPPVAEGRRCAMATFETMGREGGRA